MDNARDNLALAMSLVGPPRGASAAGGAGAIGGAAAAAGGIAAAANPYGAIAGAAGQALASVGAAQPDQLTATSGNKGNVSHGAITFGNFAGITGAGSKVAQTTGLSPMVLAIGAAVVAAGGLLAWLIFGRRR